MFICKNKLQTITKNQFGGDTHQRMPTPKASTPRAQTQRETGRAKKNQEEPRRTQKNQEKRGNNPENQNELRETENF